jgi:hypothetical protein
MSSKRNRVIKMPAPYLKRIWIDPERVPDRSVYPFCLPFLGDAFELSFRPRFHHHRRREWDRQVDPAGGDRGARGI